jgi:hypothetical protein
MQEFAVITGTRPAEAEVTASHGVARLPPISDDQRKAIADRKAAAQVKRNAAKADPSASGLPSSAVIAISPEQRARIDRNKQAASEKRKRLKTNAWEIRVHPDLTGPSLDPENVGSRISNSDDRDRGQGNAPMGVPPLSIAMDSSSTDDGGRGTGDACSPAPADDADMPFTGTIKEETTEKSHNHGTSSGSLPSSLTRREDTQCVSEVKVSLDRTEGSAASETDPQDSSSSVECNRANRGGEVVTSYDQHALNHNSADCRAYRQLVSRGWAAELSDRN